MLTTEAIVEKALALGFDLCGVCASQPPPHFAALRDWVERGMHGEMAYMRDRLDLRADPSTLLPGCQSIVAVGLNYYQEPPGNLKIARYALGRDYHKVLRSKMRRLASWMEDSSTGVRCRPCVDSAPIMERDFAQLAGLGWFGKNTMLINSARGSWFFIGLLLTTLELEPSEPSLGGCGTCRACIDACPTGAIIQEGGRWQVDARQCISYQTIERRGPLEVDTYGWVFGCDVCQEVCPFNQPRETQPLRAQTTREPEFLNQRTWPGLAQLAMIDHDAWDQLTQGSAVRRAGHDGLRRNAQAAIGESEGSACPQATESDPKD